MSKTRMGKRVASLLLSLVMMLSLLPTTVYATGDTGETKNAIVEETNTSDDNTVGGTTGNPESTSEDEGGGGANVSEGETAAVATIGEAKYETLDAAIEAVADGQTIVVNAGEYKLNGNLSYTGKAFTIAAADGADVSFDMSAAVALHGAKITFNNVTFDYKTNGNYIGLQHTDTLVYNNCTINGMVFLYAVNETFNGCTFNQESADAYNVWTYGAQNVAFNGCTFNCVGRCVLVYNEGAIDKTDLTVENTEFNASAPAEGKAAIEIDTSLMAGGATITVDDKTTDTGFAAGSNSGKTLWNDKKQTADTNKNTTVTVAGEKVFEPKATVVKPVSVNGTSYETLEDAIDAATPDANGVVTYEISGKVDVTATGWVQVAKSGLTGLTAVKFVGTTDDAKICINGGLAILADQNYDIDVSFEALALSKLNPTYGGDYGHSTNYFTTWLRNSGAAENTVTYTNCTFPNGVSNNQYGKTVFDNCKFTNGATGLYNLWNYGGSTEIKNSSFTGTRGIKAYSEGVDGGQIEVADTTFNGLGEKAAIVVSKATTVTLNKVDATECTKGLLQKDIDGGSLKTTIEANGTGISGKFDITATTTADAAKNEFNISAGTFTSEVSNDYCADGFEVKANDNGTYGVVEAATAVGDGTEAKPYTLEQLGAMTRQEYIDAQNRLNGTMYVTVGDYTYGTNGVLGHGVRDDTTGQIPDHSKLNAYGENGYLGEKNDGANGKSVVFVGGSITSGVTGYTSIDKIGTSLLLALPAYTNVTFKGTTFNNVMSFNYQLYTSPWSQLGELKFDGCTFNGIIVGAIAAQTLTFNRCEFKNYTNTTDANNSNPTWIRPAYGNWTQGDNEGQGSDFRSLTTINFTDNKVTSTRPVKFEYISQWDITSTVTATGNYFDISKQDGDTTIKNVGLYLGAHTDANAFNLVAEDNTKSANTAALYTIPEGKTSLPLGSTVKDTNGNKVELTDALKWKAGDATADKIVLKTVEAVASVGSKQYGSLQAAIDAATAGQTVILLTNVNENVEIAKEKNLTLDLNGKTLSGGTGTAKAALSNLGTITIQDTSAAKTGTIKRDDTGTVGETSYYVIRNQGTMTIESGIVINNSGYKKANPTGSMVGSSLICNGDCNEGGTLTIKGGTFTQNNFIAIKNGALGVLHVSGGTITSNHSAIQNWFKADITGGEIKGQLWTDAYKADESVGQTTIGGDAKFTGEIVMDIAGSVAPTLAINGGNLNVTNWRITSAAASVGAKPVVSGGTFTSAVPEAYCAEGFIPTANADGTYGVKAGAYVAQIGDVKYETLKDAVNAAKDGDIVTLLADATEDVTINKNITLDLGGKTLTNTDAGKATVTIAKGATATVQNGSIIGGTSYYNIQNNGTATFTGVTATAGNTGSSMIDNWGTLTIESGDYEGGLNVVKSEEGSTLTINGGKFTGTYAPSSDYTAVILVYGNTTITGGEFIQSLTTTGRWAHPQVVMTGVVEGYEAFTTVTGGTFTNKKSGEGIFRGIGKATSDNFEVSGGTFNKSVPDSYFKTGYFAKKTADGYTADGPYAVRIGTTAGYATLEEAFAAAKNGNTITLLRDCESGRINLEDKNVTVDLNGKVLTSTAAYGVMFCAKNGHKITVKGDTRGSKLVGTLMVTAETDGHIVINGGTYENNQYCPIYINGAVSSENSTLTVKNATITALPGDSNQDNGVAVYLAGYSTSTFTRTTITAPVTGLEIRAGKLTLTNCTVTGGSGEVVTNANGNGTTVTNAAVAISQHTTKKDIDVTITGGTYTATAAVYQTNVQGTGSENVKVSIKSGTFKGAVSAETNNTVAVSGGTFSSAVKEEYCATGYIPKDNGDGTYGVKEGVYVAKVDNVKYETLQAAINAAKRNATVTMLANTRENVTISTPYLTLDLNGFTLNGGTEKGKPALTVTARVTVKDSSTAQTGTIMREDTAENSGVSSHYVIDVQGGGWLTFESGTVKNNSGNANGKGASLVRVGDDSVAKFPGLNIKGGTFTQDNFIVIKVDRGDLFLNGGTLNSAHSYAIEDWHRATIKGGTVNGTVAAWTYSGGHNSDLTIEGGTVNGNVASVSYDKTEGKLAKVSITGGTVTGTLGTYTYNNGLDPIENTSMATIEVTGGTFDKDPTKYVVEGSTVKTNSEGKFGVEKAYLAKVGDTSYYTMDEAFKAQTASGEPIVMLRDYTTGSQFKSGSINRTVDLDGHTWTYTGTDTNDAAFEINYSNVTLTVKNGTVVSNSMVGLIPSAMGGTITYDNSGLVFENVTMTANGHSGIETNGNNTNDTVTLKNSTLNVPNGFGIYFPSSGKLTIDNSTINAKTMGVQVCAGSLSINDGSKITVNGDAVPKTENDGAIQDGAAISIVNRTGYKGLENVTVTGGKFTAKTGNEAIKAYNWANKTASKFTAAEQVAVSGGTFSSAVPEGLCAPGFIPTTNGDGTYGVKAGVYVAEVNGVAYATLSEAIAAAKDGDTVKLLRDINTPEISYMISKSLTIDLNGMTVTGSGYDAVFQIDNADAKVVIKNGKVVAVEQSGSAGKYTMAIWASKAGCEVTLEGLDVSQKITHTDDPQMDMIYASGGTITINSGNFVSGTPAWTLNCNDTSYKNGTAKIIVTGGTFVGFDPANNKAEGENTNFVPAGYVSNMNEDGSYTVVPEDAKIDVKRSLTLGNTLIMNYKVLLPEGYTNPHIVFESYDAKAGAFYSVPVADYTLQTKDEETRYVFAFTETNPQRMTDTLKATVYATKGETEKAFPVDDYSVADYCNELLISDANENGAYNELVGNLVAYGTAAQLYQNYHTDKLVGDVVNGGTVVTYPISEAVKVNNLHEVAGGVAIKTKSLVLNNAFAIRVKFTLEDNTTIDQVKFTVAVDGKTTTIGRESFHEGTLSNGTPCYYFDFADLNSRQLGSTVTFTAVVNGTNNDVLEFSANTYLKLMAEREGVSTELMNLLTTLYNYGCTCDSF